MSARPDEADPSGGVSPNPKRRRVHSDIDRMHDDDNSATSHDERMESLAEDAAKFAKENEGVEGREVEADEEEGAAGHATPKFLDTDNSVAYSITKLPFTDPPPACVLSLWDEVAADLESSSSGWELVVHSKAVDSLECARHYLECSHRYLRPSASARAFVDKCMLKIIRILLGKKPTKVSELDKYCTEASVRCSLRIISNDLKAMERSYGRIEGCPSFDTLWIIFDKDRKYYKAAHPPGSSTATRSMIHAFQQMNGFFHMAMYMNSSVSTPDFPGMAFVGILIDVVTNELLISECVVPACSNDQNEDAEAVQMIRSLEQDAIYLSESIMKHMLCLDEKTLENEGEGTIRKIIAGVFRLYLRLSDSTPLMIDNIFGTMESLLLKLTTSQFLSLKRLAWGQIRSIISASENIGLPPLYYVVSGAGCNFVNGRYDLLLSRKQKTYMKPEYHRKVPIDVSLDSECACKELILQCNTLENPQWVLSEANPAAGNDIQYYISKTNGEVLPPSSGWLVCHDGINPPPTLKSITLKIPEDDTFKHQLARWAVDNGMIERALEDSTFSKIVSLSTEFIGAVGRFDSRVFARVAAHSDARVSAKTNLPVDLVKALLQLTCDLLKRNLDGGMEQRRILQAKENAKLVAQAVMRHLLELDEDGMEMINLDSIDIVRYQCYPLLQICSGFDPDEVDLMHEDVWGHAWGCARTAGGNSQSQGEMQTFFGLWRSLALKLIASGNVTLKALGWDHITYIIAESIKQHSARPASYIVSGAGREFVNGLYELSPEKGNGPVGPLVYHRRIPDDDLDSEGAGKTLTLYRCNMESGDEWWFISESVDVDQPVSELAIDYYEHKSGKHEERLPPPMGWSDSHSENDHPLIVMPARNNDILVNEDDDLEHQFSKWVIENGLMEIALGDSLHNTKAFLAFFLRCVPEGFTQLATCLNARATTKQFPPMYVIKNVLEVMLELFYQYSKEGTGSMSIVNSVTTHMLSLDEETLGKICLDIFQQIRSQLFRVYSNIFEASPQLMYNFFDFWRDMALKFVRTQSLSLKLFGWDEVQEIIEESKKLRPPPKAFIVSGAGEEFVNGRYDIDPSLLSEGGYVKPNVELQYHREIPVDDPDAEGFGETLALCRCYAPENKKWFLSSDPDGADYYKSILHDERLPPSSGWITCVGGNPPPKLETEGGLVVPPGDERNTLEHQLAKWAIENGLVKLALGESTHTEIVPKSKGLLTFLAGNYGGVYPIDLPDHYRLKPSHILLAFETCKQTEDIMLVSQLYLLLVSIYPQLSDSLKEFATPIIKDVLLLRIEKNDPTLLELQIGESFTPSRLNGEVGVYVPRDEVDFVSLGQNIANNTNLEGVHVDNSLGVGVNGVIPSEFFDGLRQNMSIRTLSLDECDVSRRSWFAILRAFCRINSCLTELSLSDCGLGDTRIYVVAAILRHCTQIEEVNLPGNDIDHTLLVEIVPAIRGHANLVSLNLCRNGIGRTACGILAAFLRGPSCNLITLDLSENQIDDNCAMTLANALARNTKLENLHLDDNGATTESGWEAFSCVMCDTSSINNTYFSNHTLNYFGIDEDELIDDLSFYLDLNKNANKSQVAIRKILHHHNHFDMKPLFPLDLKVLPIVIGWFGRARACAEDKMDLDTRLLTAVYQFFQAMPLLLLPACGHLDEDESSVISLSKLVDDSSVEEEESD